MAGVDVELFAVSDIGNVRERNEDAYVVGDLDRGEQLARDKPHSLASIERVGDPQ